MTVLTRKILKQFNTNICSVDDFKELLTLHPSQIHTVAKVAIPIKIDYKSYTATVSILSNANALKLSNIITSLPNDIVEDLIRHSDFELLVSLFEHLMDQYQYARDFKDVYRYNDVLCVLGNRLLVLKIIDYETDNLLCKMMYYTNIKDYDRKGRMLYNNVISVVNYDRWVNYRKLTNSL